MPRPARSCGRSSRATTGRVRRSPSAPMVIKDKVISGISGGEFGVRGFVTANDVNTGKQVWRMYSTGPGGRSRLPGIGRDLEGRRVEAGRRHDLGLVQLRPRAEPLLLRHRQPRLVESRSAAGRQQVLDDDLRPQSRHREGGVGLSEDAARRVGLRRHQRERARRLSHQRADAQGAGELRPQRLRLRARPQDRRAAAGRSVRAP